MHIDFRQGGQMRATGIDILIKSLYVFIHISMKTGCVELKQALDMPSSEARDLHPQMF